MARSRASTPPHLRVAALLRGGLGFSATTSFRACLQRAGPAPPLPGAPRAPPRGVPLAAAPRRPQSPCGPTLDASGRLPLHRQRLRVVRQRSHLLLQCAALGGRRNPLLLQRLLPWEQLLHSFLRRQGKGVLPMEVVVALRDCRGAQACLVLRNDRSPLDGGAACDGAESGVHTPSRRRWWCLAASAPPPALPGSHEATAVSRVSRGARATSGGSVSGRGGDSGAVMACGKGARACL